MSVSLARRSGDDGDAAGRADGTGRSAAGARPEAAAAAPRHVDLDLDRGPGLDVRGARGGLRVVGRRGAGRDRDRRPLAVLIVIVSPSTDSTVPLIVRPAPPRAPPNPPRPKPGAPLAPGAKLRGKAPPMPCRGPCRSRPRRAPSRPTAKATPPIATAAATTEDDVEEAAARAGLAGACRGPGVWPAPDRCGGTLVGSGATGERHALGRAGGRRGAGQAGSAGAAGVRGGRFGGRLDRRSRGSPCHS